MRFKIRYIFTIILTVAIVAFTITVYFDQSLFKSVKSSGIHFDSFDIANRNYTWETVLSHVHSIPVPSEHEVRDEKIAIIIPYRNRERQLLIFLQHMVPIFRQQKLNYRIFVIEQNGTGPFNRAKLLNTGFVEASKADDFDCYFLHDVDILLEDVNCLYSCSGGPIKHFSTQINKFKYQQAWFAWNICLQWKKKSTALPNFGGISRVTKKWMLKINGFSNLYWHWGAEDDDFYMRNIKNGIKPEFNNLTSCKFSMLEHKQEEVSESRSFLLTHSNFRTTIDGLNSLKYSIVHYTRHELYTIVLVNIGYPNPQLSGHKSFGTCSGGDSYIDQILKSTEGG